MNFLTLSDATATTARAHAPDTSALPRGRLSVSHSATALDAVQDQEQLLVDATLSTLSNHLESIVTFVETAMDTDTALAGRLHDV